MTGRKFVGACMAASLAAATFGPGQAQAGGAGALFGGVAGGVLGGVIAGAIIANSRPQPTVVYARPRPVRVVRPAPRARVVRAKATEPTGSTRGAQVINTAADPFAKTQGPETTAVSNKN